MDDYFNVKESNFLIYFMPQDSIELACFTYHGTSVSYNPVRSLDLTIPNGLALILQLDCLSIHMYPIFEIQPKHL